MPDEESLISVSHINVRISISMLLLKLFFLEIFAGFLVILLHTTIFLVGTNQLTNFNFQLFQTPIFVILVVVKMFLALFIIMQWLNEYYEITPEKIVHRYGVIFRKEEDYYLSHVMMVDTKQTLLGRILNYGTITIYDARRNKYEDLYLIHNPIRYSKIIEGLTPRADQRKWYIRGGIPEEKYNGYSSIPKSIRRTIYRYV